MAVASLACGGVGQHRLPQLDDPPLLGPLTVDAVSDWLRDGPARAPVLARMVSLLEDPEGQRVVITATTADEALPWIAAATLLLPIRAALEVSFKVFCANPWQASQRIVAVLKELNPQIVPGRVDQPSSWMRTKPSVMRRRGQRARPVLGGLARHRGRPL